jgi:hypothetical protein
MELASFTNSHQSVHGSRARQYGSILSLHHNKPQPGIDHDNVNYYISTTLGINLQAMLA